MLSKSQIALVKSLQLKKFRRHHQLFVIEGKKIVLEAIRSSSIPQAIFSTQSFLIEIENQQMTSWLKNIEIVLVTADELKKISSMETPNDVLALMPFFLDSEKPIQYPIIALDGIQDPGNLGTIVRTADWFDIKTVVTSNGSVDFYNSKVLQASMGSFMRVRLKEMELVDFFTHNQRPVYGGVLNGRPLYHMIFETDCIFLMGNESMGISPSLAKFITHPLTIPRHGHAESLNVAVATSLFCAEYVRSNK